MWETILKKDQEDKSSLQFIEEGKTLVDGIEDNISGLKEQLRNVWKLISTGGQNLRDRNADGIVSKDDFVFFLEDFQYAYEEIESDCKRLLDIGMLIAEMEADDWPE